MVEFLWARDHVAISIVPAVAWKRKLGISQSRGHELGRIGSRGWHRPGRDRCSGSGRAHQHRHQQLPPNVIVTVVCIITIINPLPSR